MTMVTMMSMVLRSKKKRSKIAGLVLCQFGFTRTHFSVLYSVCTRSESVKYFQGSFLVISWSALCPETKRDTYRFIDSSDFSWGRLMADAMLFPSSSLVWRCSNGIMGSFFTLAAYVQVEIASVAFILFNRVMVTTHWCRCLLTCLQLNDPDPELWVVRHNSVFCLYIRFCHSQLLYLSCVSFCSSFRQSFSAAEFEKLAIILIPAHFLLCRKPAYLLPACLCMVQASSVGGGASEGKLNFHCEFDLGTMEGESMILRCGVK